MTLRRDWRPFAVIAVTAACVVAVAAGGRGPVRLALALAFFLFCPGLAVVPLMRLCAPGFELVLALALSLATGIVVSEVLLLARLWSEPAGFAILAALSLAGAAAQLLRARRRAP